MSPAHLLCFAIALIPGLVWLFLLALRYRQDKESRRLIIKTFLLGMVICTPAGFFNTWLISGASAGLAEDSWVTTLLLMVFIVGPNEEGLKFLIVWSEVYKKWRFRSEMDGIIFATASAIGFATYENAVYMLRGGIEILYIRAWACTLAHLCFSAIFGYYLGLAKAKKYNPRPCIAEGLVSAALAHGLYNVSVSLHEQAIYVVVPLLVAYYMCLRKQLIRPYLSFIAPQWMAYSPDRDDDAVSFQMRRFPVHKTGQTALKVREALDAMEGMSDEDRLLGIETSRKLADQRILERVKELTHDPVDEVREQAEIAYKEMRRKLRMLGHRSTGHLPQ